MKNITFLIHADSEKKIDSIFLTQKYVTYYICDHFWTNICLIHENWKTFYKHYINYTQIKEILTDL